jgi:hypothetical protein
MMDAEKTSGPGRYGSDRLRFRGLSCVYGSLLREQRPKQQQKLTDRDDAGKPHHQPFRDPDPTNRSSISSTPRPNQRQSGNRYEQAGKRSHHGRPSRSMKQMPDRTANDQDRRNSSEPHGWRIQPPHYLILC